MHDGLRRRLRDEVDAELGTRPRSDLSEVLRRGRGKRAGIRLMATLSMVLVVAGGLWISRTISSPSEDGRSSIQPADDEASPSQPTPRETPENAERSGRRVDLLDGEVTFRTATWGEDLEWRMISEEPMGPESLLRHEAPSAAFLVIADPAPLQSCSRTGATVVSADVLAGAIRAHPGLSSTDPIGERVAGVHAFRLDVAPVDGASTCRGNPVVAGPTPPPDVGVPVITGTRKTYFGPSLAYVLESDKRMRLYLLDLPGGAARSLAIVIVAAEADFNAAVEAARPILDSFEFHGS